MTQDVAPYVERTDRLDYISQRKSDASDLTPEQLASLNLEGPIGTVGGLEVFIVDGDALRLIDQSFTEDANGGRYGYTPNGQLWVERNQLVNLGDTAAILLHGAVEHLEMRDAGASYDEGHAAGQDHERALRLALQSGDQPQPTSFEDAVAIADDWTRKSGHYTDPSVNSTLQREPEEKGIGDLSSWAEREVG